MYKNKKTLQVQIILIDSNLISRERLAKRLESTRFRVIASGASLEAIPLSLDRPPELIVVGENDITILNRVIQECRKRYPAARQVALGDYHVERLMEPLKARAHAYIGRDIPVDALVKSLELTMSGTSFICQSSALIAPNQFAEKQQNEQIEAPCGVEGGSKRVSHILSEKEIAILECLVRGESNKVIARKRRIAEATVKAHIKSILRKIRAVNRTQAAVWAMTRFDFKGKSATPLKVA